MKNKKIIFRTVLAILFAGFVITGCKKKSDPVAAAPLDDAAQQTQSASDQAKVEGESDQAMDDCNSTMQGVSTTRGSEAFSFPCGVSIDTLNKAAGIIVLNYNGNNCAGTKFRSGSISIQISMNGSVPHKWKDQNAKVTLTFTNYKVTNLTDQKSITFNGTHTIINYSGGAVADIITNPAVSVTHKIRANMTLTFDDNSVRTWGTQRIKVYNSITAGVIQVSVSGDSTITSVTPHINFLSMWGTNRAGENFNISIPVTIVYNVYGTSCLYKPLSGQRNHYGVAHEIDCTYGVDASGNHDTSTCPHGWKANWTNAQGVAKQVIVPY